MTSTPSEPRPAGAAGTAEPTSSRRTAEATALFDPDVRLILATLERTRLRAGSDRPAA